MQGNISNNLFANCHSTPFQEFFVLYHPLAKFVNCRTIILPKVVLRSVSFVKDQLLNCQMLLCIFISDQLFANHRPRSFSIVLAKFAIPLGIIYLHLHCVIVNQFFFLQSSIPTNFCVRCANHRDRKRCHFLEDLHIAVIIPFILLFQIIPFRFPQKEGLTWRQTCLLAFFIYTRIIWRGVRSATCRQC